MATFKEPITGTEVRVHLPGDFEGYDAEHEKKLAEMFADIAAQIANLPPTVSCVVLHALKRAVGIFFLHQAVYLIQGVSNAQDPKKKAEEIFQNWHVVEEHVNPRDRDDVQLDLDVWGQYQGPGL